MLATRVLDVTDAPLEQDFEKLFNEHYPLVYRTAYSITGSREDAEDVLEEAISQCKFRFGQRGSCRPLAVV